MKLPEHAKRIMNMILDQQNKSSRMTIFMLRKAGRTFIKNVLNNCQECQFEPDNGHAQTCSKRK